MSKKVGVDAPIKWLTGLTPEAIGGEWVRKLYLTSMNNIVFRPNKFYWDLSRKEERTMRTSEDRKRLHLLMWGVIAETGCTKEEALVRIGFPRGSGCPPNECFACEEAGVPESGSARSEYCDRCPVVWGTEARWKGYGARCHKTGSPFKDIQDGMEKAKAILALPFKGAWAVPTKDYGPGSTPTFASISLGSHPWDTQRPMTLRDVKVGDTVWFRDGSTGEVIRTSLREGDEHFAAKRERGNFWNYKYDGTFSGAPQFGQVVFATYQDLVDRGLAEPVEPKMKIVALKRVKVTGGILELEEEVG